MKLFSVDNNRLLFVDEVKNAEEAKERAKDYAIMCDFFDRPDEDDVRFQFVCSNGYMFELVKDIKCIPVEIEE